MTNKETAPYVQPTGNPHPPHNPQVERIHVEVINPVGCGVPMSQMPTAVDGCVACNRGWDGVMIPDGRGRAWHLDCAQQVLAQFLRVNKSEYTRPNPITRETARAHGYIYESCGVVLPDPNE